MRTAGNPERRRARAGIRSPRPCATHGGRAAPFTRQGAVVAGYRLTTILGAGGMGVTYVGV
ncbi:MAG TPA: hypothetical protein VK081_08765, partial [Planctomycetota bacterium]|nr:hypothetical protein [Planctomycetota bacterium]